MSPLADGVGGLPGQVRHPDGGLGQGAHHITGHPVPSVVIILASEKYLVNLDFIMNVKIE